MSVNLSPSCSVTHDEAQDVSLNSPSARLGALTRKKNQIRELCLDSSELAKQKVKYLYKEYCTKIETFTLTCEEQFDKAGRNREEEIKFRSWTKKNIEEAESFAESVKLWLGDRHQEEVRPQDSVSNRGSESRSHSTKSSSKTSTSSLRLKLAKEKADTLAEARFREERSKLELQRLEEEAKEEAEQTKQKLARAKQKLHYEDKLRELQLQEGIESQNILEKELDSMHNVSCVSKRSKSQVSKRRVINVAQPSLHSSHPMEELKRPMAAKFEVNNQSQNLINQEPITNQLTEVFAILAKNQERASLPKNEPDIFNGTDLTKYDTFMQSFQSMIVCHCDSDSDKLYYLEKYTTQGPRQLVRSCIGGDASIGYAKAMKLLKHKYGNEYKIANAYLSTLERWPPIKSEDGIALEELSIYLMSCANNMMNLNSLNQLNSPKEMATIVDKLPYDLRKQWRTRTYHIMEKGSVVSFDDLVKFVDIQASILNQPLFGNIKDSAPNKSHKIQFSSKKKSFATQVEKPPEEKGGQYSKNCLCCKKNNHSLEDCFFFGKKDHSEKIEFIKANKLCFGCLKMGHSSRFCRSRLTCKECKGKHPTVLHRKQETLEPSVESIKVDPQPTCSTVTNLSCQTGVGETHKVACTALPVIVRAPGSSHSVKTYIGLDTFSTECFMSDKLLLQLGIKSVNTELNLTTMGGISKKVSAKVVNNLEIFDLDENEKATIPVIYSQVEWPFTKNDSPKLDDQQKFPYLKEVPMQFIDAEIGILIGINMPEIIKPLDIVDGQNGGPYATKHKFGWAISGPVNPSPIDNIICSRIKIEHQVDLENKIDQMYSCDFADSNIEERGPSIEDQKWQEKVGSSLKWKNGHFEVDLPFRDDNVHFPTNYGQVYSRLQSTKRRLKNNAEYFSDYNGFMDTMIKNGFAERVPNDEINATIGDVWYLVHHGIYHKQKQKLRVVFDCSLKFKGVSLNSELLQGPDLTNNLLGVLLRFRQGKVAFMGDIEKMFYQVKVPRKHINFMRFLWFPDGNLNSDPVEYRLTVHVFGAVSSPSCSNFVLRHTAQIEDDNIGPEARKAVIKDFYVDDLIKSVDTDQLAIALLKDIANIVAKGGFNLTGFVSNSRKVLNSIPPDKLSKNFKDLDLLFEDLPQERTLGVAWNVEQDTIGFRPKLREQPLTRRGILSTIFSIYDPLGMAAPVTLPAKRIFQQTCRAKLQWDEKLPEELKIVWQKWLREMPLLSTFEVPRCYNQGLGCIKGIQLHIFCDGSETAYGAVAYLRFEYEDEEVRCSLVMAKTRLTPMNGSTLNTIPRIELNGARLAITIQQILHAELELQLESEHFWTDSTTVLRYINCENRRFQRFVSNRVNFIRSHSKPCQWRHVPGQVNPADQASRCCNVASFLDNKDWRNGPTFLLKPMDQWPSMKLLTAVAEDDLEIKRDVPVLVTNLQDLNYTQNVLNSSSSWYKTKMRIVWILRYKSYLLKKVYERGEVSVQEINLAEIEIFKFIQKVEYSETIARLQAGQCLKKSDPLLTFDPFLDDNLLRIGGRLKRSVTSYDVKHPIILPKTQHVVRLLIEDIHRCVGHLGKESILSTLRRRYWIVAGSRLIRSVTRDCVACRKRHGQPSVQIMADLPIDRITGDTPAFTSVGTDYFGPFMVTMKRSIVKRYGVIFTCLASRAVHLEIAHSLDTDSFLCALRRFMARRGQVRMIRSDNGTNFVGGNRELKQSIQHWNSKKIENCMKQNNIDWKFQPPAASHFGGIWEREIRTIRKVLDALMKEKPIKMTDELLLTLMCEVEGILNNRPLTELSSDPNDLEALTPNHLLLLSSGVTYPPGLFTKDDVYAKRRWKQVQYLADLFWSRWRREYLPLLQSRQKWMVDKAPHQVGDLVLIVDNLLPRNQWSMGRIINAPPDEKGCVRKVKVKVSKIKSNEKFIIGHNIIERPVVKLILLRSVENL